MLQHYRLGTRARNRRGSPRIRADRAAPATRPSSSRRPPSSVFPVIAPADCRPPFTQEIAGSNPAGGTRQKACSSGLFATFCSQSSLEMILGQRWRATFSWRAHSQSTGDSSRAFPRKRRPISTIPLSRHSDRPDLGRVSLGAPDWRIRPGEPPRVVRRRQRYRVFRQPGRANPSRVPHRMFPAGAPLTGTGRSPGPGEHGWGTPKHNSERQLTKNCQIAAIP